MSELALAPAWPIEQIGHLRFRVQVTAETLDGMAPTIDVLVHATEVAIQGLAIQLFTDAGRALGGLVREHRLDTLELFPELSGEVGLRRHVAVALLDEWLRRAIDGAPDEKTLAAWQYGGPEDEATAVTLIAESVEFVEGSLTTRMTGVIAGATLLVAMAATPPAVDAFAN